jgi:hypothetical protein
MTAGENETVARMLSAARPATLLPLAKDSALHLDGWWAACLAGVSREMSSL